MEIHRSQVKMIKLLEKEIVGLNKHAKFISIIEP